MIMVRDGKRLGIIAGGGDLPIAIAQAAQNDGREVFLLALEGMANAQAVDAFPHAWASLGELGKLIRLLKDADCYEITMAGKVHRPEIHRLKLDARGALALPRVIAAAIRGDDALLRALIGLLEKEGLHVIGSAEAARDLLAPEGPLGELEPTEDEQGDVLHGIRVVRALGELDIGQAAVVCRGLVLAVEAAEGTDAMLTRVASLPEALRGTPEERKGALVKALKPNQERRVDLPVIGTRTVELAAAGGLAGIAVQGGATLIIDRARVAETADLLGLFVYGFSPEDYRSA
jgi:UDP-2,3-diacylglucosamine hydrolase